MASESISSDGGQGFSSSSSSSSSPPVPVPIISRRRDVVGLSLELGETGINPNANTSTSCATKKEDMLLTYGRGRFTFLQLEELHQQALIYKYMEAGLPVPSHLILPIWKSVATSFASLTGTGCNSSIYGEYRSNAEVEPGRCKRTDGKKWRCAKDVVPHQKYCQKHLHRGRHRSRKLVEAPITNSTSTTSSHPANS